MSIAHSNASKKRMKRYSKDELRERMRSIALIRWAKATLSYKKKVGKMLLESRGYDQ